MLRAAADATDLLEPILTAGTKAPADQITVPPPDLGRKKILLLADIHRALSGKVVGPKAANLGQLNRLFPGRVAPALAIPFGIYASHLEEHGLRQRIKSAYAAYASGGLSKDGSWPGTFASPPGHRGPDAVSGNEEATSTDAMAKEFGPPGSYGVFVRSDTNVEDLPQFTGAGLSETVANVTGIDTQLGNRPPGLGVRPQPARAGVAFQPC